MLRASIGVLIPTIPNEPPGPAVGGYGISRSTQSAPVRQYSTQSKFTPRWSVFSKKKPRSDSRMRNRADVSPPDIECDSRCRNVPCIGSSRFSIAKRHGAFHSA